MKASPQKEHFNDKYMKFIIVLIASMLLIYLLISLYFTRHFFFYTEINGVNLSLKSYHDAEKTITDYVAAYELRITEKDGASEVITGQSIGMQFNKKTNLNRIQRAQKAYLWIGSVFRKPKYYVKSLYHYKNNSFNVMMERLNCINRPSVKSQNVSFKYSDGSYKVIKEFYGDRIIIDKLRAAIETSILEGKKELMLYDKLCYELPEYTVSSGKTYKTLNLLNRYVSTVIVYQFGNKYELLDGSIIHKWISVDDKLEAHISTNAVKNYVHELSEKYDTIGKEREFTASIGKTIEVKGGLYGWKINQKAETEAILESISKGQLKEKEPAYSSKAVSRDGNEIGSTYIEINITKQHLWFYKDGKLIAHGSVVTGNPNRGNPTVKGVYTIMYKQKNATLSGPGYEVGVTYWMPFYGNMGVHDASWRSTFGGQIYKTRGTHGCVNAPLYLARKVFDNIEDGVPVIVYEEEIVKEP